MVLDWKVNKLERDPPPLNDGPRLLEYQSSMYHRVTIPPSDIRESSKTSHVTVGTGTPVIVLGNSLSHLGNITALTY